MAEERCEGHGDGCRGAVRFGPFGLVLLAVLLLAAGAGCSKTEDTSTNTGSGSGGSSTSGTQGAGSSGSSTSSTSGSTGSTGGSKGSTASKPGEVTIVDYTFTPETKTVKVGEMVTWTNTDAARHSVKSDTGTTMNSDILEEDKTYQVSFSAPGTNPYHCGIHNTMKGTIVVQ